MKRIHKSVLAVVFALVVVLGVNVTAFAEDTTVNSVSFGAIGPVRLFAPILSANANDWDFAIDSTGMNDGTVKQFWIDVTEVDIDESQLDDGVYLDLIGGSGELITSEEQVFLPTKKYLYCASYYDDVETLDFSGAEITLGGESAPYLIDFQESGIMVLKYFDFTNFDAIENVLIKVPEAKAGEKIFTDELYKVETNTGTPLEIIKVKLTLVPEEDFDFSRANDLAYLYNNAKLLSPYDNPVYEKGVTYINEYGIQVPDNAFLTNDATLTVNGKEVYWKFDPVYGLIFVAEVIDEDSLYSYDFLDDSGNVEIKAGDAKEIVFHIDAPLSQFKALFIGDVEFVKNEDYTLSEGSTIITLTDKGIAKVNAFSAGEYDIKAQFKDGSAVAFGTMTVTKGDEPEVSPKTGDAGFMGIFTIMMLVAAAGAVAYRKREF